VLAVPQARLKQSTELLYQPRGIAIPNGNVAAGEQLSLLTSDDETKDWFRVFWSNSFGWVPVSATDKRSDRFEGFRAPPLCAQPQAVLQGVDNRWSATRNGQFVTVIDLYRIDYGAEVATTLQIRNDGDPITGKNRPIRSSGQFLMRGSAIPVTLAENDELSFGFLGERPEGVEMFVAVFFVPNGCVWEGLDE
jgi:hypothetical protein